MIYVMSDLHGCYDEYIAALDRIQFSSNDTLYILGDVIDRGEGGLKILQHMMMYDNIVPLIGNHEVMALSVLKKLCTEITEESVETTLNEDDFISLDYWCQDGGLITLSQFQRLLRWQQEMILDYFDEFRLYDEVSVNGRQYVLMHAGIHPAATDKLLKHMRIEDLVFASSQIVIPGKTIVCGHTPTSSHQIEIMPGMIRIDCGCVYSGQLGVLCLDTLQSYYIQRKDAQ